MIQATFGINQGKFGMTPGTSGVILILMMMMMMMIISPFLKYY
jgi:hypothetical protein